MTDNPEVVLAIDYGLKMVGFAFGDTKSKVALAAGFCKSDIAIGTALEKAREKKADLIIVGLPRSHSGDETEQSRVSRSWADSLRQATSVPVEMQDEFSTTALARESLEMQGQDLAEAKESGLLDEVSAQIILQGYFQS